MIRSPFKAYDIRGRVPAELDNALAFRIGQAYARVVRPVGPVIVGRDVRDSSSALAAAVIDGMNTAGVDTLDIGLCGTEMVYFAAAQPGRGGGIMVTASHNPIGYNGMKLVHEGGRPISGESGLREIERLALEEADLTTTAPPGSGSNAELDILAGYIDKLLEFVHLDNLEPLHLVVNAGNGCAGPAFDALAEHLPFRVTRIDHEPDARFPHGIPNPLLPENRERTAHAVIEHGADLGIAWDGDFDRCFLFDENGRFIEGYYLVGLLAETLLKDQPGEAIIHDPRLTWNTIEQVKAADGRPVQSKTGHAFIKERMRQENALYGGEMSAHHYFRDFAYCDSGMIPWLLVARLVSETGMPLSKLVDERMLAYPCSGELNFEVANVDSTLRRITEAFESQAQKRDETDGISLEFADWRFNLRASNTEPVIRLNVETRGDAELLERRTQELRDLIQNA